MKLRAGQLWARNIHNNPARCRVETCDIAKVNNDGTFTGGFHVVGDESKFEWRENVAENEILDNKEWMLVGAMTLREVLESRVNLRKMFWKVAEENEQFRKLADKEREKRIHVEEQNRELEEELEEIERELANTKNKNLVLVAVLKDVNDNMNTVRENLVAEIHHRDATINSLQEKIKMLKG